MCQKVTEIVKAENKWHNLSRIKGESNDSQ